MAKGHRLLKKRKLEKSKVKLKGSATKLKPASNITDTSFKFKPIVIREQLKVKSQQVALSKRKLNIKELLTKLQHYNSTVRNDAVKELKELIISYPEEVKMNFSPLLSGMSHLVLDKEKSVRRETLRTISLIISQASVEQLSPFFDILSSYLRCAMTHIDSNIQEDSLLLLDSLLEFAPSLVVANSHKIMENFFDLISKLRNDFKPGRTLTMNLGRKMTVVKWRIKVLNRLYHMLSAITEEYGKRQQHSEKKVMQFNDKSPNLSIYHTEYVKPCVLILTDNKTVKGTEESENNILSYTDILMPLLFETWLEVGPAASQEGSSVDSAITEEATTVLTCILNILTLIFSYMKIHEKESGKADLANFVLKYKEDYSNYIMKYLPYSQTGARNEESQCALQNFMICRIFCLFYRSLQNSNQRNNASRLLRYVQSSLSRWRSLSNERSSELINVLRILFDLSPNWRHYQQDFLTIVDRVVNASELSQQTNTQKEKIQNLLCDLMANRSLNLQSAYQRWLINLPELLNETEISEKFIDSLLLLAKQQDKVFTDSLKNNFHNILENITDIVITDTENETKAKCKILGLFYYILEEDMMDEINDFLNSNADSLLKDYLKQILIYKWELNSVAKEQVQCTSLQEV